MSVAAMTTSEPATRPVTVTLRIAPGLHRDIEAWRQALPVAPTVTAAFQHLLETGLRTVREGRAAQ